MLIIIYYHTTDPMQNDNDDEWKIITKRDLFFMLICVETVYFPYK